MRILFTLLIVCFYSQISLAQGGGGIPRQVLLDSLKEESRLSSSDAKRAEIFMLLSEFYSDFDPDTSIIYGEKALVLARNTKEFEIEISVLGFTAGALLNKGNYPKALELCLEADRIRERNMPPGSNEPLGIGPAYVQMVLIFEHIGEYEKALGYSKKMSNAPNSDKVTVAFGNYYLARIYEKMNKLDSAILSLNTSLDQFSSLGDTLKEYYGIHPELYNLRAYIHLKQNERAFALKDFKESLKMSREGNFIPYITNTLIDLSNYYKATNQSDSVIFYAEKALEVAKTISFSKGILNSSEILADAYKGRDLEKTFYYYQMATETRNSLYGAGNIQVIRDMISLNEQRQKDLLNAKEAYQNKLKQYLLLAGLMALLLVSFIFYRNNRRSKASNIILEGTVQNLKSTQAQLIQSEKMASLGELTAGIAHEIQNPLNFVNNFSEVNKELIEELEAERLKLKGERDEELEAEILKDLKENEEKIKHHGQRAEGIVKGMLEHSRSSQGEKEPTDINALADEYLRLAYHGLRAKDNTFNADFKVELDESLPTVNVIAQDIGRVLLNLINNAFYAVAESLPVRQAGSKLEAQSSDYKPEVIVSTKKLDGKIEISVKDNGPGIPEQVRDKIFQPFFTTKPTGQGTGLGLSLSYDIVKAHGGNIKVESKEVEGSEFIIHLPNV